MLSCYTLTRRIASRICPITSGCSSDSRNSLLKNKNKVGFIAEFVEGNTKHPPKPPNTFCRKPIIEVQLSRISGIQKNKIVDLTIVIVLAAYAFFEMRSSDVMAPES